MRGFKQFLDHPHNLRVILVICQAVLLFWRLTTCSRLFRDIYNLCAGSYCLRYETEDLGLNPVDIHQRCCEGRWMRCGASVDLGLRYSMKGALREGGRIG
ncbi:hypothetical protein EYC84_011040 [Monilinia fructicola]|uniref:Uncharacterized protein n=1 Tax=Monilinia fructicola TaxID=38448 RepID=A0A5M9J9S4_MONFR|nr:hypothetical protein EYC84_011040 [Monilinia fructicola]